MLTISALELRNNMKEIFRRVRNGEEIAVTYRDEPPVLLRSQPKQTSSQKRIAHLEAFLKLPKMQDPDPGKSVKTLYRELLEKKHIQHDN